MQAQLTIGDFSRLTHLSVKTLRYYHQIGLLEPHDVNESTGYRYYDIGQVQAALTIRRLRDLDMPVEEVGAVLRAPDSAGRDALLAAHLDRMQAQLAQTAAAISSLRDLLEHPAQPIRVEIRDVPPRSAIAISRTIERDQLMEWWAASTSELSASGVPRAGPAGGIFDNALFTDERGAATLFFPTDAAVPGSGRMRAFTVPAARLAVTTHDGSHRDADRTYAALGAWVAEHQFGTAGPVREYYVIGAVDTGDVMRWRTEICWQI